MMEPVEAKTDDRFFPRGAIFFFALMLLLYGGIWLVIYLLMIARS